MASEARCERTDLLVSQCAHCRGISDLDVVPLDALVFTGTSIGAQYAGKCAANDAHVIEPGDRIYHTDAGWVCQLCKDWASV